MAFINYILFDKNFVQYAEGFDRIHEDAYGSTHDRMALQALPTKPGYIYIYISNETPKQMDVYFDDMKITHQHGPVIQTDDYYPFGLTFNSSERSGYTSNNFLYNGKEIQQETGWYDYGSRMYDATIGRFHVQDRYAEKYLSMTPYQYGALNPIKYIDVNGDSTALFGLFNSEMAGKEGYDKNGLNLKMWNQLSKGIYDVSGITLAKPNVDGENLKIEGIDKKVGSKSARMLFKLTFNNSTDNVDLNINPEGLGSIANFESTVDISESGAVSLLDKKVNINLDKVDQIQYKGIDRRTLGVGMILAHEFSHQWTAKNDKVTPGNPRGTTVDFVNEMRKEMRLSKRLHYKPFPHVVIPSKQILFFEGGRAIIPANK
jgi:RHS repeat-associated protein